MADPGGWMLALAFLGTTQAPDDPLGREPADATSHDEREATALARRRAAAVALPEASARRLKDRSARDKLQVAYQFNGRQVQLSLEPGPADPAAIPVRPPAPGDQAPAWLRDMALASENFDRLVFPPTHREPNDLQMALYETLAEKIRAVESAGPLTRAERGRLLLAGGGDIQRFYARVAAARADFDVARVRYASGIAAARRLEALAVEYDDGPFGPDSLFGKVLTGIDRAHASR